jgi:GntR family transcriptional regulator
MVPGAVSREGPSWGQASEEHGGARCRGHDVQWVSADGEAKPGERLPPAKDLAAVMGVNTNTALRALRSLRDEGLLEFRRGLGIRVRGTADQVAVASRARDLVAFARKQGYRPEELVALIEGLR